MAKMRDSEGSGSELRPGEFYIRVTDRPQHRTAKRAPWAKSLDEADQRAKQVQTWVNRLRAAGKEEFIDKLIEVGAKADDPVKLAELGRMVGVLAGGDFDRLQTPAEAKEAKRDTFRGLGERWTSGELHRLHPDHIEEKASVDDDVERLEKHVYPHVADVPMRQFTRKHADLVMAKLPAHLKAATRRHVAQLVNRIVRLAMFLGIIDTSPLPPGWLPKVPAAESIGKEALLPSEEAMLLRGRDASGEVVVPLEFRVLYAFLHREGMRKGEAKALDWTERNATNGLVSLDENKTDRPRSWVLQPDTQRLLDAWHELQGKPKAGRIFAGIPDKAWRTLAGFYREHSKAVGIDRDRLFQRKANKLRLRAHDMRAFFVTAGMFAGHDALWITDRTGHRSLAMLRRYERDVRMWRELGESPAAAAAAIPEIAAVLRDAAANAAVSRQHDAAAQPPSESSEGVLSSEEQKETRCGSQVVRQRIANPLHVGSNPIRTS
jgi:hypothetical protein